MTKRTLLEHIRDQWTAVPPVAKVDLSGKIVVVVGANTGIGFETCKHFASMNPTRIIMVCRSEERGAAAIKRLIAETKYEHAELWIADLAKFASVSAFADKFDKEVGRLDILILNAGIFGLKYSTTEDEWETALQVNCMASPLLALRLLPCMKRTAQEHATNPRIVVVSSDIHHRARVCEVEINSEHLLEMLSSKEYCSDKMGFTRYGLTKALNVLFMKALQERLSPDSPTVAVTAVTPGLCYSDLGRDAPKSIVGLVSALYFRLMAFTAEQGSRQVLYAALSGDEEMRGAYVAYHQIREPSDFVLSEDGQRLKQVYWSDLVHVLSKVDAKIPKITRDLHPFD
ncbi:short-chain dehydrogenase [Hymenopellis radicata]|nr:short-chain dehydrogenase [Hymenopellis radicata]